jgi:hypothetical protein
MALLAILDPLTDLVASSLLVTAILANRFEVMGCSSFLTSLFRACMSLSTLDNVLLANTIILSHILLGITNYPHYMRKAI